MEVTIWLFYDDRSTGKSKYFILAQNVTGRQYTLIQICIRERITNKRRKSKAMLSMLLRARERKTLESGSTGAGR